jgi:hypothetical protein
MNTAAVKDEKLVRIRRSNKAGENIMDVVDTLRVCGAGEVRERVHVAGAAIFADPKKRLSGARASMLRRSAIISKSTSS